MSNSRKWNVSSIVRAGARAGAIVLQSFLIAIGLALVAFIVFLGQEISATLKWTPLHAAVGNRCESCVRGLLDSGADPNAVDDYGRTPVSFALATGQSSVLEDLLMAGADASSTGPNGQTPLHQAVELARADMVRALLGAGADPLARQEGGDTALHVAAHTGDAHTIGTFVRARSLATQNTGDKWAPLHGLARSGHAKIVLDLLEAGASLDVVNDTGQSALAVALNRIDTAHQEGRTALHIAALQNDETQVRHLLDAGANANGRDREGMTVLHAAANYGRANLVRILLRAGADPNGRDATGRTALHQALSTDDIFAAAALIRADSAPGLRGDRIPARGRGLDRSSHAIVVGILLASGARSDLEDKQGVSPLALAARVISGPQETECDPLHRAAMIGQVLDQRGRYLIRSGEGQFEGEWSPLHGAALVGNLPVLRALQTAGASLASRDCEGRSALHLAAAEGELEAVRLLLDAGAEIDAVDIAGWSAVATAAIYGHLGITQALLERGASLDMPRHYAYFGPRELREVVRLLGHAQIADLLHRAIEEPTARGRVRSERPAPPAYESVAEALLAEGVESEAIRDDGATSVHLAVLACDSTKAKALIAEGGSPNAESRQWGAPLVLAASHCGPKMVRTLTESGADPNVRRTDGTPPAFYADQSTLSELLRAGADPDAYFCETALHDAVKSSDDARALVLLRAGANPDARNYFGRTPIMIAKHEGVGGRNVGTIRILELGARLYSGSASEQTATEL